MLQWRKWRDSASEVVSMQLEASMETALIQVASHYINVMQVTFRMSVMMLMRNLLRQIPLKLKKLRGKLVKEIRKELEQEIRAVN